MSVSFHVVVLVWVRCRVCFSVSNSFRYHVTFRVHVRLMVRFRVSVQVRVRLMIWCVFCLRLMVWVHVGARGSFRDRVCFGVGFCVKVWCPLIVRVRV